MTIIKNKEIPSHESPEMIKRFKNLFQHYVENQGSFGKRFNLNQTEINDILKGRRKISGIVLKSMAIQNIDIRWLLIGEGKMFTKLQVHTRYGVGFVCKYTVRKSCV